MKFHKQKYPITSINLLAPKTPLLEWKTGWVEETNEFGFAKSETTKAWSATDLASGTCICIHPTRKGCVEEVEKRMEEIQELRKSDYYLRCVQKLQELLAEEELNDKQTKEEQHNVH